MNLVAIGSIGKPIASIAYDVFDDIQVLAYNNLVDFMNVINMHPIDIHRMIMSDNALDNEVVPDEVIDSFVNLIQMSYPAMKLVTISKSMEMTEYFSQILVGMEYIHICVSDGDKKFKTTHKFIEDIISCPTNEIKNKYRAIVFNKESSANKADAAMDVLDDSVLNTKVRNEEIEGYVQNPNANKPKKRSLFDKIIGRGPKQSNNSVVKDGSLEQIGQGFGVENFSEDNLNPFGDGPDVGDNFEMFDPSEADIGLGMGVPAQPVAEEEEPFDRNIFENTTKPRMGEEQVVDGNEQDFNENGFNPNINAFGNNDSMEDNQPIFEDVGMNNPMNNPNGFDMIGTVETPKFDEDVTPFVPVAAPDISSIKNRIENTNLNIDMSGIPDMPQVPNMPLSEVEPDNIEGFGDNFNDLMKSYEDSNMKIVEKQVVVEKVVKEYVNVGGGSSSGFVNRNGVRVLVFTGDRRVGTTKLALNVAAKFARGEKVLYVDFDRNRHGSLGYLDIERIMEEPEHISDGLNHYNTPNTLMNIVHLYDRGGFYTLTSMYGSDVTDDQMNKVEKLLMAQKNFSTVIIDCPIENLYLLDDILRVGHVIIIGEDDKIGILNLITSLGLYCMDEKQLAMVFERSYFVIGRKNNAEKFNAELADAVDLFGMAEAGFDWCRTEILGTTKNISGLMQRLVS